jgi:hypothetical protein
LRGSPGNGRGSTAGLPGFRVGSGRAPRGGWWGSGSAGGTPIGGVEEGQPSVGPGQVDRQAPGDLVSAGAGWPGGDVDQLGADGGAAGLAVLGEGEGARARVRLHRLTMITTPPVYGGRPSICSASPIVTATHSQYTSAQALPTAPKFPDLHAYLDQDQGKPRASIPPRRA